MLKPSQLNWVFPRVYSTRVYLWLGCQMFGVFNLENVLWYPQKCIKFVSKMEKIQIIWLNYDIYITKVCVYMNMLHKSDTVFLTLEQTLFIFISFIYPYSEHTYVVFFMHVLHSIWINSCVSVPYLLFLLFLVWVICNEIPNLGAPLILLYIRISSPMYLSY